MPRKLLDASQPEATFAVHFELETKTLVIFFGRCATEVLFQRSISCVVD
jgi:hypothetical protein